MVSVCLYGTKTRTSSTIAQCIYGVHVFMLNTHALLDRLQ